MSTRRVWTRDDAKKTASVASSDEPTSVFAKKRPRGDAMPAAAAAAAAGPARKPNAQSAASAALQAKIQEARAKNLFMDAQAELSSSRMQAAVLRKKIDEEAQRVRERKVKKREEDAARAESARVQAEEAAVLERSRRLQAGFAAAVQRVAASGDHATGLTADSAGPEAARRSADADEVGRVLCALTDADALGLPPNPAPEAVKRAYRALAKRLHPDKCTAARATDAFQRIAKAYQRLGAVH